MGNGVLCRNFSSEAFALRRLKKRNTKQSSRRPGKAEHASGVLSETGGASGVAAERFFGVSGGADRI